MKASVVTLITTGMFIAGVVGYRSAPKPPSDAPALIRAAPQVTEKPDVEKSLRDFLQSITAEPSPLEATARILRDLPNLTPHELGRLVEMLEEFRYRRDPGFLLVRTIVRQHARLHHPEAQLRQLYPGGYWKQFLRDWADRDVEAAFHAAMQLAPEHMRGAFLYEVFEGAAGRADPHKIHSCFTRIQDTDLRHFIASSAMRGFLSAMPETYADLARTFPMHWRDIHEQAFTAMAQSDPDKALKELENVPAARREAAIEGLLDGWTFAGKPAEAAAWATEHGHRMGQQALASWAYKEPMAAMEHAWASYTGEERLRVLDLSSAVALKTSPDEVTAWMEEALNATEQARLLSRALVSNATAEPASWQIEAATKIVGDPNASRGGLSNFVDAWQDKEARLAWILSIPDVPQRQMIVEAIPDWFLSDPTAAANYIDAIPNLAAKAEVLNAVFENNVVYKLKGNAAVRTWALGHLDAKTKALIPNLNEPLEGVRR